ncbi:MAG: archaemetzincin family Zn-dependent metalloprotease [Candidatus ainarchaeum sp.]|nr:archaemetzincin family Zn-dependent metalloprotease [Candidatus ainarchaeum sp.]
MRILVALIGRTMPGFHPLLDLIGKEFGATVTTEFLDMPITRSFRSQRGQYDAEVFLKELAPMVSHHADMTAFITREDLFAGGLNFVFGLASGRNCIVSLARLDPRFYGPVSSPAKANAIFKERIQKETLHELGHTSGLGHCDDKNCVMSFSNSLEEVDAKGRAFCERCKKEIKTKSG